MHTDVNLVVVAYFGSICFSVSAVYIVEALDWSLGGPNSNPTLLVLSLFSQFVFFQNFHHMHERDEQ